MNHHSLIHILTKGLYLLFISALATGLDLSIGPASVAHAATFSVNSPADAVDANPGDGVCATAGGVCTLRAAIQEANALPGADTIVVPAGIYTLSSGQLAITAAVTIIGAGAATSIIDGASLDQVLHIVGGTVEISSVTIRNGTVTGVANSGGIENGGTLTLNNGTVSGNTGNGIISGIFSVPTLTLTLNNSTVSGNTGDGIVSEGTLTLVGSTVSRNSGDGILNHDTATFSNSTVSGNTGDGILNQTGSGIGNARALMTLNYSTVSSNTGRGIENSGTVTVTNSTISGNTASAGGGILNELLNITSRALMTVTNSTVSSNTALGLGAAGGIFNYYGTLTLNNSTVSGNSAGYGGGILNYGTLTLNNSTVSGNSASRGGGGGIGNSGTTNLKNTIVANSSPVDCTGPGAIVSAGHNLSSDGTCGFTTSGDQQNTNPLLGPLASNGGPTLTHALLPGSPAIDAGSSDCPPPATDQRGITRPQGAACDIGAFEVEAVIQVTIDIKPGSFPNSINTKNTGVIPVAILSTTTFDAPSRVDKTSLKFGRTGTENSLAFCNTSPEDVNGDGLLDLVCYFYTQRTGFQSGDTQGTLTGKTVNGIPIKGTDSVRIVP